LGRVMKAVMARLAGRADGKVIQEMARRRLSS
jgi:Glu-tRNA(Gln) amidotransferase subunit E-like FAD-binding protein